MSSSDTLCSFESLASEAGSPPYLQITLHVRVFLSLLPVGYAGVFSDPGKQPYAGGVTGPTSKPKISAPLCIKFSKNVMGIWEVWLSK